MNNHDIARFFKSRKAAGDCPYCGTNDWDLVQPPVETQSEFILTSAKEDELEIVHTGSTPVFTLVCTHCYHIRLHAAMPIRDWIRDNPA